MERNRENKDFVMYFRPFMDELTKMAGENYTAYKLFQFFCKNMDGTNALVVSMNALSEIMSTSTKTIQRAVKYLSATLPDNAALHLLTCESGMFCQFPHM